MEEGKLDELRTVLEIATEEELQDLTAILQKMLARTPIHRYQLTQQVMADLQKYQNQQQMGQIRPAAEPRTGSSFAKHFPSSPSTNIQSDSTIIDRELEEIRTTFLGGNQAVKPQHNHPSSSPSGLPASRSKVDEELEEIRNSYLGNTE